MKHLTRAGAILGLLLIVFVLLRLMPPPEELESYGFYRGEDDSEAWASQPIQYANPLLCQSCHEDKHDTWNESKHSNVSCENCHEPGQSHIEEGTSLIVDISRESCGLCHTKLFSRPSDFPQVDPDKHGGQLECISCHNPHDPQEPRASELPLIPHLLDGRSSCLACHDGGYVKPFPESHEGRGEDTCLECHESK
jgi:hypothetical protein